MLKRLLQERDQYVFNENPGGGLTEKQINKDFKGNQHDVQKEVQPAF